LEVLDLEEKNLDYNKSWGQQDSDTKVRAMNNLEGRLAEEFLEKFRSVGSNRRRWILELRLSKCFSSKVPGTVIDSARQLL
jgi:hypothetical protein